MSDIRLVPINQQGQPAESIATVPKVAAEVCDSLASLYEAVGFEPPWIGYLALSSGQVVGSCAFKAPPTDGKVEIAYFTFPEHEGKGVATQMTHTLIALARASDPSIVIIAQTLPETNASTSILKKLGFVFEGIVQHPEDGVVWEWHLAR